MLVKTRLLGGRNILGIVINPSPRNDKSNKPKHIYVWKGEEPLVYSASMKELDDLFTVIVWLRLLLLLTPDIP